MATIIDELIVSLGIDGTKFQNQASATQDTISKTGREAVRQSGQLEDSLKKTQDQTGKRLKQTEDVARQSQQHFTKFRLEVAALFAALATGFGYRQFIENVVNSDAALGRQAKNLGVSVQNLGAWEEAVKRSGGTAGEASASFQALTNAFLNTATGNIDPMLGKLRQLGVSWSDVNGHMKDQGEILIEISQAVSTYDAKMRNFKLLDLGFNQSTANLLAEGPDAVRKRLAEAQRGGLASPDDVRRAQEYQRMLLDVQQRVTALARSVFADLEPSIKKVIQAMQDWFDKNKEWLTANLATTLQALAGDIVAVGKGINDIVGFMGGWRIATEVLFALWVGSKFLAVIASVTRLLGLLRAVGVAGGVGGALGGAGAAGAVGASTGLLGAILGLTAGIGLLYEGLHPSAGAGSEELEAERKHTLERAREHPELVIPPINPGVPYQPGTLPGQMGITPGQYKSFSDTVAGIEHADYSQMGGSSGRFAGRYQMGSAEIKETAGQLGVQAPTQQQFLSDPGMQERFMEAYTARHHAILMNNSAEYRSLNQEQRLSALAYAHNQGTGGAMQWLKTGQAGHDAFGTSGTRYSNAVARNLQVSAVDPTLLRYGSQSRNMASDTPRSGGSTDNSVQAHINSITIVTQATDSTGIAKSIKEKLNQYAFVRQANRGLA